MCLPTQISRYRPYNSIRFSCVHQMCKLVCHFRNSTTEIYLSLSVKSTFSYSEDIYHNIHLCTDRSEKKTILGKHLNRFIKCNKSLLCIQSFRVNIPISVAYKYAIQTGHCWQHTEAHNSTTEIEEFRHLYYALYSNINKWK